MVPQRRSSKSEGSPTDQTTDLPRPEFSSLLPKHSRAPKKKKKRKKVAFLFFHARSRAAARRIHPRKWTIATEVGNGAIVEQNCCRFPVPSRVLVPVLARKPERRIDSSAARAERILEIARARTSDDERGSSPFGREQAATPPYIFPLMPRAGFNGRNTGGEEGAGAREARRREASRRLHRRAQRVNVRA